MKRQHQNTEDAAKWEPSGLPKSICWHDTLLPLVGDGIAGPKIFSDPYAANMQPNHFCATLPGRTLSVTPWSIVIVEGLLQTQTYFIEETRLFGSAAKTI